MNGEGLCHCRILLRIDRTWNVKDDPVICKTKSQCCQPDVGAFPTTPALHGGCCCVQVNTPKLEIKVGRCRLTQSKPR